LTIFTIQQFNNSTVKSKVKGLGTGDWGLLSGVHFHNSTIPQLNASTIGIFSNWHIGTLTHSFASSS